MGVARRGDGGGVTPTTTSSPAAPARPSRAGQWLVLAGVVVVAFNLRTAITVVGPLIPSIRADLGATNTQLGLVGTLPVLAFGLFAPVAALLGRKLGIGRSLAASLVLLAVGIAVRSAGGLSWLLLGTAVLGIAITVGNVLLPSLIKARFPDRVSTLTSGYSAIMVLAATVSAGVAVPLATATSWELSAGIWALPALLGAVVVAVVVRLEGRVQAPVAADRRAVRSLTTRQLYRSPLAWQTTAFMGLQSTLFYVTIAWLPDIVIERGLSEVAAGTMVGVLNLAGLVGVLSIPLLVRGRRDQRLATTVGAGSCVVGAGMLLVPGTALVPVSTVVLGLGLGGTVGLALSFFALRTATPDDAAGLSGMAQTWGYLLSALGPVAWGALRDATGSWTVPLVALVVVAAGAVLSGLLAARDRVVTTA